MSFRYDYGMNDPSIVWHYKNNTLLSIIQMSGCLHRQRDIEMQQSVLEVKTSESGMQLGKTRHFRWIINWNHLLGFYGIYSRCTDLWSVEVGIVLNALLELITIKIWENRRKELGGEISNIFAHVKITNLNDNKVKLVIALKVEVKWKTQPRLRVTVA